MYPGRVFRAERVITTINVNALRECLAHNESFRSGDQVAPDCHILVMQLILQAFASILFLSHASIACYIAGTDSGECTSLTIGEKGADWRADNLPYCQYSVLYPACVPKADQVSYFLL